MNTETLKTFNEKAELILESPLAKNVLQAELKCSFSWVSGQGAEISSPDFSETELHAFILTLRMFCQPRDSIALVNIQNDYASSQLSQQLRDAVSDEWNNLNTFLDSRSIVTWDNGPATYRELFDVVLYGDLAHLNPGKEERYKEWISKPMIVHHVNTLFLMVLQHLMCSISLFRVANIEALKEMNS